MAAKLKQAAYIQKKEIPAFSWRWLNWLIPLMIIIAGMFWAEQQLSNAKTLPVKKIRVHGTFINLSEEMLYQSVSKAIAGGYFNIDVEHVREEVEQLPWVKRATVRRVWPDTLSVSVIEQKPVAVAKGFGLVNTQGEVFKPAEKYTAKVLPVFDGKPSLNMEMLQKYHAMNALLAGIQQKIVYMKFDARHALQIELDNGLKLVLGRGDSKRRLQRMLKIYPRVLAARVQDIDVIDLRYTNGMAISWKKKMQNSKAIAGDMNHV